MTSSVFFPPLRLGHVVLPPPLIERCRQLKRLSDLHSAVLEQLALAHFIEEGYLERHILKLKKVSGQIHIHGDAAGLHLVAGFGGRALTEQTLTDLVEAGVHLYPVEQHAIQKGGHQGEVILGYGNLTPEEIEEGVRRIKSVLTPAEEQATGFYSTG